LFRPDAYRDLFRVLADSLDEAVLVLTDESQQVQTCNHAFLLLTGYARSDVESLAPRELFSTPASTAWLESLPGLTFPPDHHFEDIDVHTRDGVDVRVDVLAQAVGSARTAIVLRLEPSDARRRDERAAERRASLLHAVARLSELVEEAGPGSINEALAIGRELLGADHLALYKISASGPDYDLVGTLPPEFPQHVPSAALEPMRASSDWTQKQRSSHLLHKAARASGLQALRTVPVGETTAWVGVLIATWQDESSIPADAGLYMALIARVGHAVLIRQFQRSELTTAQATMAQLDGELRGLFQASGEAMLVLDSSWRVVRANPAAAAMLAYQPNEMLGHPVQDILIGPGDIMATLLDARGHERSAQQGGLSLHRRDGTPFPAHLRAVPLSRGQAPRLLVILQDHSERQAMVDQTEMLAQRALLGEVTAIFAHEVRNPINNISTGVQLVASRLGEDHPLYASLDRVHKECNRLDQLMRDVLFFARPLELKIEPIDLAEMLQRLVLRWGPRFHQAEVRVHTDFAPDLPRALADPRTFEQVVVNIMTNALQAMSKGGTLSLNLATAPAPQGTAIELKIADTGPGIPPDVMDRIFDPFFTTKKEGTGLGLAISRRILTAHKGGLSVESFPGAGTVFTIRLPAAGSGEGANA
jgi:PAS domain S-box-containing protein